MVFKEKRAKSGGGHCSTTAGTGRKAGNEH